MQTFHLTPGRTNCVSVCVCVCVRACVRAYVRASKRGSACCVRTCCVCVHVCAHEYHCIILIFHVTGYVLRYVSPISRTLKCVCHIVTRLHSLSFIYSNGGTYIKKASSYIAQYPVLRTAQSALHYTSLTDLFTQTPSRLLWEASSHMLQLMHEG